MQKHITHRYAHTTSQFEEEIGDYMSTPVLSVGSQTSIRDAAKYMNEKRVGSLLVKDGKEYVGVLTETDLTRKVLSCGLDPESTTVTSIMTHPILSMDNKEALVDANKFMAGHKIRHLAVTREGRIEGMLSVRDLVHYFSNPRLRTQ